MAIHVEAIQPFRPKECDDTLSVGGHRAISVRSLGMALQFGRAFMRCFVPKDRTRVLVKAEYLPLLHVVVLGRFRISIKADLQSCSFAFVNRARDKQTVSPNGRTGMAQSG